MLTIPTAQLGAGQIGDLARILVYLLMISIKFPTGFFRTPS